VAGDHSCRHIVTTPLRIPKLMQYSKDVRRAIFLQHRREKQPQQCMHRAPGYGADLTGRVIPRRLSHVMLGTTLKEGMLTRAEVEVLEDSLEDLPVGDGTGAICVHVHGQGLGNTNGV